MKHVLVRLLLGGLAAATLVAGASLSGAAPRPAGLVAPGSHGPVDLGDTVRYTVRGPACTRDPVRAVVSVPGRRDVVGPVSRPARDPLEPGACVGHVRVPVEAAVRRGGWDAGDRLEVSLRAGRLRLPLRYQRLEVEHAAVAAGTPTVVTPAVRDTRGGARDRAVELDTGDALALGRVDLSQIHSVSLRVCMVLPKPHLAPTFVELRATAVDGPTVVGPVDVNDDALNSYKSSLGWPDCWQLQTWPVTGAVPGRAPELFLVVTTAAGGPVQVSYVDVNGSGAKVVEPALTDPRGTRTLFDGTGFAGWEQSGCALDEGGVRPVHTRDPANYAAIATAGFVSEPGCTMTYTASTFGDVLLRLDYRLQHYGDNGGVYLGDTEIQMREAGEWLTGGVLGSTLPASLTQFATQPEATGYPAQRVKNNTYPDWSRMEVVRRGTRVVVRVNGRTVSDCACLSGTEPFTLRLQTQPGFSYRYGVNGRFDSTFYPSVDDPSTWGNLYFRDVRVYRCTSPRDRACSGGPGVRG